jgi:formate-dependent nitrite reductase membrane component NrfD
MVQGFNMELRSQQEWGWLVAAWLFLSGSGSGLFLLFEIYGLPLAFALLSLAVIVLGGVLLLLELGSPLRAWRGVSRLSRSWLSRGALSVCLFVVCGSLFIAPHFAVFSWLPWTDDSAIAKTLEWIAALCALVISLYPGFFLAKNRSIPFWNTALLPLMSFGFAVLGASGLVLLAFPWVGAGLGKIQLLAAALIVASFVMVCVHLYSMQRAGGAAGESVRLLNGPPLSWAFHIGVGLVGMILPLAVLGWFQSAVGVAGAGILVGALLFRYCILKAGVYLSAGLAPEGIDLSTLKRASAELRAEYAGMAAHYAGRR